MDNLNIDYNNENAEQARIIKEKLEKPYYYACCCQTPEKPHDECSKFKFITVEDVKNDITPE
jgi:hypothetical protein